MKKTSKKITLSKADLVDLILERVESILLEQGLTGGTDPFAIPDDGTGPLGAGGEEMMPTEEEDPAMAGMEDNPSADAEPLLSMEDLESMEQPDARKTLLAGLQSGGEEYKTTADLVAAILGDPTKAQQDGVPVDPEGLPASPELQQTATDVATISGLSLQESLALKDLFKTYLSEKKRT